MHTKHEKKEKQLESFARRSYIFVSPVLSFVSQMSPKGPSVKDLVTSLALLGSTQELSSTY